MINGDGKRSEEFDALMDAHVQDLETASAGELVEGLAPADIEAEAGRVLDAFQRAKADAGRRRMQAARSGLAEFKATPRRFGSRPGSAEKARELTMAARNGTGQSDGDRKTVQDDLDELAALRGEDGTE